MVHSEKFQWPSHAILRELDLSRTIKLCGLELGMTSNLFQIRLHFTNGLRSPMLRAEGAGLHPQSTDDKAARMVAVDPTKQISDVYFH